ncbi:MAG: ribose 5-phosphate isomerase B [Anaerovoracaceae bacterium]|jgi:ribose 5-phosphate isomerase B
MKIAIACDHGGYELKEMIAGMLDGLDIRVVDVGPEKLDPDDDYPEYGFRCGEVVAAGEVDGGIVVCGSGIGISIAANKVKGVRCALCTSREMAELARRHNDANMIALGGRTTDPVTAMGIVETWLNTEFEGGRHQRRVDKLNHYGD